MRRGFTILELLVAITVIAILVSVFMPALSGALQYTKRVTCMANLRQAHGAIKNYVDQYQDWMPATDTLGIPTTCPANKMDLQYRGNRGEAQRIGRRLIARFTDDTSLMWDFSRPHSGKYLQLNWGGAVVQLPQEHP